MEAAVSASTTGAEGVDRADDPEDIVSDMTKKRGISRRGLLRDGTLMGAGLAVAPEVAAASKPDEVEEIPQVPRRTLGRTGKKIPILLFGGAIDLLAKRDPRMKEAFAHGVNYLDAAALYGDRQGSCERAIGQFAREVGDREKVWITSKSDLHDLPGFQHRLGTALERLGTDYIDLYFLHGLEDAAFLTPQLEEYVAAQKAAGRIRHFGFSCHSANVVELLHAAAERPWVEAVMFRYNFQRYGDEELNQAIDAAHDAGVGLIAMKTQASSVSFKEAWEPLTGIGKWSRFQAVLKAVWADPRITAAVSHMDSLPKVRENIAAALDRGSLGATEWDALERYASASRHLSCDGCDHLCNPAVDAPVRIGDTLRYLTYHESYAEPEKARRLFALLPEGARRGAAVADFAAADRACPHGVEISHNMRRAAELLA